MFQIKVHQDSNEHHEQGLQRNDTSIHCYFDR